MTKSWNDIRQEACRLYSSGWKLVDVQKHLKDEYDFEASIRSYRSYFKKWGVTRTSELNKLKQQRAIAAGRSARDFINDSGHVHDGTVSEGEPSLPLYPDLPIESVRRLFEHTQAGPSMMHEAMQAHRRLQDHFESTYRQLRTANRSEREEILNHACFDQNSDNILHFTATKEDPWTLNSIVDYMLRNGVSIDTLDKDHRTALEIAIQSDRFAIVEALLRAGASLKRRNTQQQQPLHFCIAHGASTEVVRLLLEFDADVNSPLPRAGHTPITPLHMALERFQTTNSEREKDVLCLTLQQLIDHGAETGFASVEEEPLMRFIEACTKFNRSSRSSNRPSALLAYYLRADLDPLCWFPKRHCPAEQCESVAAFIFNHTPTSGLSRLLIERSDLRRHGRDLLFAILTPCEMRYRSANDPSIHGLLTTLLELMSEQDVPRPLEPGLVRHVVFTTLEKHRFASLEPLVVGGWVGESECREVLKHLDSVDDHFRLALTDLLLPRLNLDYDEIYGNAMSCLFDATPPEPPNLPKESNNVAGFQKSVLDQLQINPPEEKDGKRIVWCVVHVFTKSMLDGKKFGRPIYVAEIRIYIAIRLRQRYELPDIPVSPNLVLELNYIKTPRSKQFRSIQQSEDSPMGDAAYATPESTR